MENECTCKKNHKKYQGDKTFKFLHLELYCHFFDNEKTPFKDKYICLHNDAFSKIIYLFHQSIFVLRIWNWWINNGPLLLETRNLSCSNCDKTFGNVTISKKHKITMNPQLVYLNVIIVIDNPAKMQNANAIVI